MILVGINFSSKSTYVSLIDIERKKIMNLNYGEAQGIRNAVYYKNKKMILLSDIFKETKDIVLENYIPNLHQLLVKLFDDSKKIESENSFLTLQRSYDNGIEIIL